MRNIMNKESNLNEIEGLLITVNLKGAIKVPTKQIDVCEISHRVGAQLLTKKIIFSQRGEAECSLKTRVSGEVAKSWASAQCPEFSNKFIWNKMKKKERLVAHIARFDQGYGVSFEIV